MDPLEKFKAAQKAGWALDVACVTGVVAVTAARMGARVTGLDLTPELLEQARANAQLASVEIDFHEGDVEQLPFDAEMFDVVVSQYGHMFAPRPEVATREMLRVLKRGGTIAFSTWPPELFIGRMFRLVLNTSPLRHRGYRRHHSGGIPGLSASGSVPRCATSCSTATDSRHRRSALRTIGS